MALDKTARAAPSVRPRDRSAIFLKPKLKNPRGTTELLKPPFPLSVPLEFRRSTRARRISLKVDHARGRVVLVAPIRAAQNLALDFLTRHEAWLTERVAQLPSSRPFTDGSMIPLLGVPHQVRHDSSKLRGVASRGDGSIIIPGAQSHLARRLTDFLKSEARQEISKRASVKAEAVGRPITALTLRDTRSRWGSCSG